MIPVTELGTGATGMETVLPDLSCHSENWSVSTLLMLTMDDLQDLRDRSP